MHALTCPLSELSATLQAKTVYHHTIRGLVRVLETEQPTKPAHALDLPFLLGLASKCTWFTAAPHPIDKLASNRLLLTAAMVTGHGVHSLDYHSLSNRMSLFPALVQQDIVRRVEWCLVNYKFFNRTERFNMHPASEFPKIEQSVYSRLEQHLADLEAALLAKDPLMPQHLRSSHAMLITYPETIHLLDDGDVAKLIDAAEIHTKTEIVKASAAGKGTGTSRKKVSISDL
jgi:hypothetical protein